jgi:NADPH:quinone reductase-like Zn-dependent oxidoreductase
MLFDEHRTMETQMTETVKIVRFHETGGPEVLRLEEHPLPEPGPGEVRLRVKAIGLNRAEVMFRTGQYLVDPILPSKLGYEASGIVEAVGPGVDPDLLGQNVSSLPAFPATAYGVYGEVAIVPAYAIAAYPAKLTYEEATSIWMQYITAYGALVLLGKTQPGDFVLLTAASSSVGLAAIEVAKAQGAISIATTRTAAKKSELLKAGADHVIVTDDEDLVSRTAEITGGKGARIIFDPIAGPGVEALAEAASEGGVIVLYGALAPEPSLFPLFQGMKKNLAVHGYTLIPIVSDPTLREAAKRYVYEHLENGNFTPRIDRTFPLSEIVQAHRYMESNGQIGKIVVTV